MQKRGRRRTSLDAWLNSVVTPVYLIDEKRRVRFFNQGCVRLTGWPASEVLGRVCEYHTEDEGAAQFLGMLCPPPEVFAGTPRTVPMTLAHCEGHALPCLQEFQPLLDEQGRVHGVLVTLSQWQSPRRSPEPNPAQQLHAELAAARLAMRRHYDLKSFLGHTSSMHKVHRQIELTRAAAAGIWITGERGVGKEHLARLLHYEGPTQNRAFVPLDCRNTLSFDLKRTWKRIVDSIRESDGNPSSLLPGTVYLIEADRMPRDVQQLVVEFLVEGESSPGAAMPRLIAASLSAPPDDEHESLLPEFLDRLNAVRIALPPLRERTEDLPLLAQHLLENSNRGEERQIEGFDAAVWSQFEQYRWPGNISELETVIREARVACDGPRILATHLPFRFRTGLSAQAESPPLGGAFPPLEEYLTQLERRHILAALEQSRHNKSKAADLLGIPRPKLYRRMQALGIEDREHDE